MGKDSYHIKKVPGGIYNGYLKCLDGKEIIYCEETNSFYGTGTYDLQSFFYNLEYKFNKKMGVNNYFKSLL